MVSPPLRPVAVAARVEEVPYRAPLWRSMRGDALVTVAFLLVAALMQVLDAGATWLGLKLGGTEVNPVMAWALSTPGPAVFFFIKAVVVLGLVAWAVYIAWRREATRTMLRGVEGLAIAFTLIVAANIAIISKHVYGLALY